MCSKKITKLKNHNCFLIANLRCSELNDIPSLCSLSSSFSPLQLFFFARCGTLNDQLQEGAFFQRKDLFPSFELWQGFIGSDRSAFRRATMDINLLRRLEKRSIIASPQERTFVREGRFVVHRSGSAEASPVPSTRYNKSC